jgi:hypothetical protein
MVKDLHSLENGTAQVLSSVGLWEGEFTVDPVKQVAWYELVLRSGDGQKIIATKDVRLLIRDMIALPDGRVALVGTRNMKIADVDASQSDLDADPELEKLLLEVYGDDEHTHFEESDEPDSEEAHVDAADYEGQIDFLAIAELGADKKINYREWRFGPDYALSGLLYKDGLFYLSEKGIRRVLEFNPKNSKVRALDFEISGPTSLYSAKDKVWIVEARAPDASSFLVSYTPKTGTFKRHKFEKEVLAGITKLIISDDESSALVLVMKQDKAVRVNLDTGAVTDVIPLSFVGLRDAARVGSCILGVNNHLQALALIDLKTNKEIANYSFSDANKEKLKSVRNISSSGSTNQFFLRSTYPCPSCSVSQSSVFALTETSGLLEEACLN